MDARYIFHAKQPVMQRGACVQVQRNWMYLENIFIGSEDIRKQLPQESLMFEGVNNAFMRCMKELWDVGNVVKATTARGVLAMFQVWLCAACRLWSGQQQPTNRFAWY